MLNVLFWNLGTTKHNVNDNARNDRMSAIVQELIIENSIDIAIFCECRMDLQSMCNTLSIRYDEFDVFKLPLTCRVKMIIKTKYQLKLLRDSNYYFIFSMQNNIYDFILSGVHLPSKLYAGERDVEIVATQFVRDLREAQLTVKHNSSVIVGDFNANPFDEMMLMANYFNSIPYADIVKRKRTRSVYGELYQMFYNPMWNYIGDLNEINSTYFYDSGGAIDFYYHIYDQVIISADMLEFYDKDGLKIITKTSTHRIVDEYNKPNKEKYSDHLPIVFRIKEG